MLLHDIVAEGENLFLACNGIVIDKVTCQSNGTFTPALPISKCAPRPKAIVKLINTNTGGFLTYNEYSVGYNIDTSYVELYRTVYSPVYVKALYSIFKSYTGSVTLKRPNVDFTTDFIITSDDAKSFRKDAIFNRFKILYGNQQPYINNSKQNVFDRGYLTPSADFLFEHDKRATFKYINVAPHNTDVMGT